MSIDNNSSSWTYDQLNDFVKAGCILAFVAQGDTIAVAELRSKTYIRAAHLPTRLKDLAVECFLDPTLLPESDQKIIRHQLRFHNEHGVFDVVDISKKHI